MERDLYRIDDLLLRSAVWAALATALFAAGLVVVGLARGAPPSGADPGLAMLLRFALPLSMAVSASVGLLVAGIAMRRREKRSHAVWRLLEQNLELYVPDLVANSDLGREDVERTVRRLNNRGQGLWVWDRASDRVRDGRLESSYLHVEKCDVCHASISVRVPASLREIPGCPYCGDPIGIEHLRELKRDALAALREERGPKVARAPAAKRTRPFSLPLFLLLLVAFWPAAVVYAWWQWQGADCERPG